MKSLVSKLVDIQSKLNAPKNQKNTFGKYNYRSCEDILEALKPHLKEHGLVLLISDSIEAVSERVYVKAEVILTDGENELKNTAYAREAATKKGMDDSQITGSTSSYARKYALNGMFAIDDNKDPDSNEQAKQTRSAARQNKPNNPATKPMITKLMACYNGFSDEERILKMSKFIKRDINSFNELTFDEAKRAIDAIENYNKQNN